MKTSGLLFLAGLGLGIAATLALRPSERSDSEKPEHASNNKSGSRTLSERSIPTRSGRKSSRTLNQNRSSNSSPSAELDELLNTLTTLDDEDQLNVMLLIRQVSMLTHINESEAISMLHQLAEPTDEDLFQHSDFNEIVSVIAFARLCELNGPEAMRMATSGELINGMDDSVITWGMNSWVDADPDGAQRWFEGYLEQTDALILNDEDPSPDAVAKFALLENDDFRAAYFNGMAKHRDPEELLDKVAQFNNDNVRETLQEDLQQALINQENSAEGLIKLLENPDENSSAWSDGVYKLAEIDPKAAAVWSETLEAGDERDLAISQIGPEFIAAMGQEGIDWYMAQEVTDPEDQEQRLTTITLNIANRDYQEASDWIEQQPNDATRDRAEIAMANIATRNGEWNQAMNWVTGVADEQKQAQSLQQIFRSGWDRNNEQLKPEVMQAAEDAGFGDSARAFEP